ncbi:MAG: glycosyltransferase family 39 protein [Pseudoflavonifractor sp.]|nr:glycosyltransferase family 39 protein [Alloprevotella sp.]MCM1117614.1 glycosyltransferase family 39 protein [Pseudoflavonifractor sp.]
MRKLLTKVMVSMRCHPVLWAMGLTAMMLLPAAALTPFNTKGEPREAIVALSMLMQGDWVLPVSFGGEMPYKPPFLAWMIALISWPPGHVTEFTARIPSIIAAMALAGITVSFTRRDIGWTSGRALCTGLVAVTMVEVWRSAGICRVDMVLTAAMVGAIVLLYRVIVSGGSTNFFGAVALMSVATLTKGPVGVIIPSLGVWIWFVSLGTNFGRLMKITMLMAAAALLSLILPALWYYFAYQRGGDEFLNLVVEENFGRITGTMSYESHVNPWWYNLVTLLAGTLPYTLIALAYPFACGWRSRLRVGQGAPRLALIVSIVTLVFYSIPASKRSVYLLPMYPFMAIGVMALWTRMVEQAPRWAGAYTTLIRVLALRMPRPAGVSVIAYTVGLTVGIYTVVGAAIVAPIMRARTDRDVAEAVEAHAGGEEPLWETISHDPLLHYYTANFYLGDRIRPLSTAPAKVSGWLLASPDDAAKWAVDHPGASLEEVWLKKRSCDTRRPVGLYRLVDRP